MKRSISPAIAVLVVPLLACKALSSKSDDSRAQASAETSAAPVPVPTPPASKNPVSGLWQGRFKSKSARGSVVGVVTESGDARFVTYGGAQFVGSLKQDGDKVTGTLTGYLNHRAADTVSLTGSVENKKTLVGNFESRSDRGSFHFDYGGEYDRPATLGELEGKWGGASFGMVAAGDGRFTGKDAAGCNYAGAFSVPHAGFGAYAITFTVSDCKYAGEYRGLGILSDEGGAKSRLAFGVGGERYSHAGVLFRGELLGSEKARQAVRDAEKAVGEAHKSAGEAQKAAAEAQKAAEGALKGLPR